MGSSPRRHTSTTPPPTVRIIADPERGLTRLSDALAAAGFDVLEDSSHQGGIPTLTVIDLRPDDALGWDALAVPDGLTRLTETIGAAVRGPIEAAQQITASADAIMPTNAGSEDPVAGRGPSPLLLLIGPMVHPAEKDRRCGAALVEALLTTLTQSLALALAPDHRVVGLLLPNLGSTGGAYLSGIDAPQVTPTPAEVSPTDHIEGFCAEIVRCVRFLLEADAITGQTIALGSADTSDWRAGHWLTKLGIDQTAPNQK